MPVLVDLIQKMNGKVFNEDGDNFHCFYLKKSDKHLLENKKKSFFNQIFFNFSSFEGIVFNLISQE